MPDSRVTAPEFAALVFRILGVVILLNGLAQALFVLPGAMQEDWSLWAFASLLGLLVPLVLIGAVALPLIFHSEWLVERLFPESDKTVAFAVTRRDLLECGLALVGAWILATSLPYLARFASELIWSLEGTRRSQMGPAFVSRAAADALGSAFACVAGWVLFRHARRITVWWESRAANRP